MRKSISFPSFVDMSLSQSAIPDRSSSQKIVQNVISTFSVIVDLEDVEQDPGFANLLTDLCTKFVKGGMPKKVHEKRKQAEEKLKEVKYKYLEELILYEAIQELVMEEEFKEIETFTPEDLVFKNLGERLVGAESCDYLKGPCTSSDAPLLLGLDEEFIMHSLPDISKRDLESIIIPRVEKILLEKSKIVSKILNSEPGIEVTDDQAEKLEERVLELTTTLETEKNKLAQGRENLIRSFHQNYEASCMAFDLTSSMVNNERLKEQTQHTQITVDNLATKCKALSLKTKVLNLQVLCKTYTEKVVADLRAQRSLLDSQKSRVEEEFISATKTLSTYESVGGGFEHLVQEYAQIKEEFEEHEQTLQMLKK